MSASSSIQPNWLQISCKLDMMECHPAWHAHLQRQHDRDARSITMEERAGGLTVTQQLLRQQQEASQRGDAIKPWMRSPEEILRYVEVDPSRVLSFNSAQWLLADGVRSILSFLSVVDVSWVTSVCRAYYLAVRHMNLPATQHFECVTVDPRRMC
jgi:hypothetical protein